MPFAPEDASCLPGESAPGGLLGLPLNLVTLAYSLPFVTKVSGTARPWAHLERLLGPLDVEEHMLGSSYVAIGVKGAPGGGADAS